ncbi:hypothetical protein GS416_11070 [Rhodococcus hoagii]|nr:hypothetical protein [Prescottella equi]
MPDSEAAVQHFEDLYGLRYVCCRSRTTTAGSTASRTRRSSASDSASTAPHVELLREIPETSVWQPHSGVHHLGFVVDDLAATSQPSHVAGHHCGWADSVTVGARSAPPITATHWG